jgi:pimeloyl-ACP methyl ester carboxylesterase
MTVNADVPAARTGQAGTSDHAESTVTVRGHTVRLLSAGCGEPVLYLHGAGDLGAWTRALSVLSESHRVLRPDLPGFNYSQPRADVRSVHDLAYRTWDLIDSLGLDIVRVVGSSLGGWLAADLATVEPARVSHLVLVAAAGLRPAAGHGVDVFMLNPAEMAAKTYHGAQARERALAVVAERESDPELQLLHLRNRAASARLAWNPYFHDPGLPDRLHRVRARTLVIWGEQDQLMPAECGRRYTQLIPGARLEVLAGCGHLPEAERTAEFCDLTRAFLAD